MWQGEADKSYLRVQPLPFHHKVECLSPTTTAVQRERKWQQTSNELVSRLDTAVGAVLALAGN